MKKPSPGNTISNNVNLVLFYTLVYKYFYPLYMPVLPVLWAFLLSIQLHNPFKSPTKLFGSIEFSAIEFDILMNCISKVI